MDLTRNTSQFQKHAWKLSIYYGSNTKNQIFRKILRII